MIRPLALSALVALAPASVPQPQYEAARLTGSSAALLAANEAAWAEATVIEWGRPPLATRFRAVWGDAGLYLRFDAADPQPWHTMTRRDEHLWDEEVVEIFLDPGRQGRDYYELEISPANVVCDVRMVSPSPKKQMDLAFDLQGLETRVVTQRDAAGRTTGWTATAFLPWTGLRQLPSTRGVALPPRAGDHWRFNLFRIERPGGPQAREKDAVEAAWSETGEPSFHVPAAFRELVFTAAR